MALGVFLDSIKLPLPFSVTVAIGFWGKVHRKKAATGDPGSSLRGPLVCRTLKTESAVGLRRTPSFRAEKVFHQYQFHPAGGIQRNEQTNPPVSDFDNQKPEPSPAVLKGDSFWSELLNC